MAFYLQKMVRALEQKAEQAILESGRGEAQAKLEKIEGLAKEPLLNFEKPIIVMDWSAEGMVKMKDAVLPLRIEMRSTYKGNTIEVKYFLAKPYSIGPKLTKLEDETGESTIKRFFDDLLFGVDSDFHTRLEVMEELGYDLDNLVKEMKITYYADEPEAEIRLFFTTETLRQLRSEHTPWSEISRMKVIKYSGRKSSQCEC